jgi:crotonobetainyl-CoA:carnitine CoA-transferase CaiB-like acyl-CoA transferase
MAARPPGFGEQKNEVLAEFGFAADEIGALKHHKVARKPDRFCMQG